MPVHLTKIYTRTGDDGRTGLSDFSRVSKNDPRLVAYADVDEANSALGVALYDSDPGDIDARLRAILVHVQNDLFDVGADLCTPVVADPEFAPLRITPDYVQRLEDWCDELNEPLATLSSFILPGGSRGAAHLHLARTVTRRAERSAWAARAAHGDSVNVLPATYLNRLSDLLFIAARTASPSGDVMWVPGGERTGARPSTDDVQTDGQ